MRTFLKALTLVVTMFLLVANAAAQDSEQFSVFTVNNQQPATSIWYVKNGYLEVFRNTTSEKVEDVEFKLAGGGSFQLAVFEYVDGKIGKQITTAQSKAITRDTEPTDPLMGQSGEVSEVQAITSDVPANSVVGVKFFDDNETDGDCAFPVTAKQTSNIRSGPSKNYSVVGSFPRGAEACAIGRSQNGGWILVRYGAIEGWISYDLLNVPDGLNLEVVEAPAPRSNNAGSGGGETDTSTQSGVVIINNTTVQVGGVQFVTNTTVVNQIKQGLEIQATAGGHCNVGGNAHGGEEAAVVFSFDSTANAAPVAAGANCAHYQGFHPNHIANQWVAGACGLPGGCARVVVYLQIGGSVFKGSTISHP